MSRTLVQLQYKVLPYITSVLVFCHTVYWFYVILTTFAQMCHPVLHCLIFWPVYAYARLDLSLHLSILWNLYSLMGWANESLFPKLPLLIQFVHDNKFWDKVSDMRLSFCANGLPIFARQYISSRLKICVFLCRVLFLVKFV